MKLLLTSKAFGNETINKKMKENIKIDIKEARLLFIPTALGGLYSYHKYLPEVINFGFKKENIIIFNEKNASQYTNLDIDVIYVCGGNTFTLLKLIKECEFDKDILNYLKKGVIYIGRSAGTHLMTKNIKHVENFDDNDIGLDKFDAIGILDGIIFCHYSEDRKKFYEKALKENKYNVYKITDEELKLVNGKEVTVI